MVTLVKDVLRQATYYIILRGCNAVDEDVYPQIEIIPQAGNFCSDPLIASFNGPGSKIVPVTIDCHKTVPLWY